jgi:hypothetical protein
MERGHSTRVIHMAVRGINPFERHVEKIFLALAAAGLTGVVAWQVAGGGNTVEVNREQVPADKAYERIREKAETLSKQMRESSPSTPERLKHTTDPLGEYQKRMQSPVSPSADLTYAPPGLPLGKNIGTPSGPGGGQFVPPVLAGVAKPIAHPFMSTINTEEVTANADLAKYLPSSGPLDKAAVSVETTIDPKAIRAALEQDPDGAGPAQPLLRAWWAGTEIVEVELVRQELKPDGSWGNEQATPVLPGRKNFSQELHDPKIDSQTLAQVAYDASIAMDELLRPEWYRRAVLGGMVVGDEWVAPKQAQANPNAPLNDAKGRFAKQLADLKQQLTQAEKALANAKNKPAPKPSGGGGGGMRGPKGPGGGGGGGGGGGTPKADPNDQLIKDLERKIEELKRLITEKEKQVADLGGKVDNSANKPVIKDADLSTLLSSTEPITVWHHDIDAVRGATYRYDVRVKVNNPLFNRGSQLKDEQRDAAKSPTVTVASAGWTDPVHVDDEVYSFFTSANQPAVGMSGGTGLGTAQATLFYFTWGYWRSANVPMEPGDGMVARWTVPDETKIAAAPDAGQPAAPAPIPAGGGGKGRPAAAGGGGAAPAPGGNNGAPAAPASPVLATKEVTKERDAFLLDIVPNPLTKGKSFALIRDVDKLIVLKDPEEQKASEVFKRLEASAKAGHDQLRGQGVAAAPGNNPAPGNPAPNSPPPLQNPGRGPGGGGGGGG